MPDMTIWHGLGAAIVAALGVAFGRTLRFFSDRQLFNRLAATEDEIRRLHEAHTICLVQNAALKARLDALEHRLKDCPLLRGEGPCKSESP